MSVVIRAHFDGKVIVPDEPVSLPVDRPMEAELRLCEEKLPASEIKRRIAALDVRAQFMARDLLK